MVNRPHLHFLVIVPTLAVGDDDVFHSSRSLGVPPWAGAWHGCSAHQVAPAAGGRQ